MCLIASSNWVFFSCVSDRYVAAKTDRAPATAPPTPVANIWTGTSAADPAAEIIPRTEKRPSIDPKTSSALRLPVSSMTSSVLCTARLVQPGGGFW